MKTLLQKFFASPFKATGGITHENAMEPDRFFRKEPVVPKVAIGVQVPGYELPPTDNYQKWCQDKIDEKLKSHSKPTQHEKANNSNVALSLSFNNANGVRNYRLTPGDNFHESGPRVREGN